MSAGPYTVTQRRKPCDPELCTVRPCPLGCDSDAAISYREAFATLEEARRASWRVVVDRTRRMTDALAQADLRSAASATMPESGGKLTLPNGDVIEVEATTDCAAWENEDGWHVAEPGNDLAIFSSDRESAVVEAWCAAWNAEHGIGAKRDKCPDGGHCHHDCAAGCWRVSNAAPLSDTGWEDWPPEIVERERVR